MTKHWRIFIDWDNDGTAETAEHGLVYAYSASRGRDRMLQNNSKGYERPKVGRAILELWNDDQRFDPFYSSSPLYGLIAPERRVEIGVETGGLDFLLKEDGDQLLQESGDGLYLSDGDYYARFTGRLDDIQPTMKGGIRGARMTVVDDWRTLRDETGVRLDLIESTNTNDAIDAILDEIGWSATSRDLSGDGDDLAYFWTEGDSAAEEIFRLVESNLGQVWVSNDGDLSFRARHELYNTTEDVEITESILGEDIQTPYLWKQIKNLIRVIAHPLIERTSIEIWRLIDIPLVKAGESATLWADLTYEDRPIVATAVTTPASTTDYTMNSAADGGGSDLTANFTVTETKLGRTVKLVVANGGSTDGYITLLKLRGDALDSPNLTAVEGQGSTDYSTSVLDLDLLWQQSTESARDFALWLASWLDSPLLFPVVSLEDQDTYTLPYDLFTRVNADLDTLEIDTDFYIAKISERWMSQNGQGFAVSWMLEPADMTDYWVFTTSLGVSSRFAY